MNAKRILPATEEQPVDREGKEGTVRRIGEILPLVMARYQLGAADRVSDACEEFVI